MEKIVMSQNKKLDKDIISNKGGQFPQKNIFHTLALF
jgi:hypothetical protein